MQISVNKKCLLGEGKWGRKKCRRIPKREGDWQERVPKRSLHPKTLQNKRFGAPNVMGSLPSCSPHSVGYTRTSVHPYFPVAKFNHVTIEAVQKHRRFSSLVWAVAACPYVQEVHARSEASSTYVSLRGLWSCMCLLEKLPLVLQRLLSSAPLFVRKYLLSLIFAVILWKHIRCSGQLALRIFWGDF